MHNKNDFSEEKSFFVFYFHGVKPSIVSRLGSTDETEDEDCSGGVSLPLELCCSLEEGAVVLEEGEVLLDAPSADDVGLLVTVTCTSSPVSRSIAVITELVGSFRIISSTIVETVPLFVAALFLLPEAVLLSVTEPPCDSVTIDELLSLELTSDESE